MPECVLWRVYFQVNIEIQFTTVRGSMFIHSFDKKFAITEKQRFKTERFTWLNVDHSNIKLE